MLCCGRKKDGHKAEHPVEMAASPRRQQGMAGSQQLQHQTAGGMHPLSSVATGQIGLQQDRGIHSSPGTGLRSMVVQSDFRKVSGISTEIFRQIETVENDHHDATTAAALEAVERRGEMLVRVLDPRQMGRAASEAARSFLAVQDPKHSVHFVEIVKRPGQTLGLYIREGNGIDRSDGVFISRIALESSVYNSGCLRVGDEILAINLVDVTRMSLDDVVIVMSIPRRLVLTTRQRRGPPGAVSPPPPRPEQKPPPVVVLKRGVQPEEPPDDNTSNSNSNNGGDRGGYRGYGTGGFGPGRFLTTGNRIPLPGMADLPIHGTFPRGNRERMELQQPQQQRDLFREREAGRYPERTVDDAPLRGGSLHQQQQQEMLDHYYNYRGSEQQQQQRYPQGNLRMGSGGTLERNRHHSGTGGGVGGDSMASIDSYHPPPPLVPVTEQPKSGTGPSPHFQHHPFDRTAGFGPKTLESLAERVHPFYGMHGQPPSGSGPNAPGQMGRASTLGRTTRAGGASSSGPGSTMSLMRGNRLTRSGSDQRLPAVESGSEFYEYVMSNTSRSKSSASGTYGGASTPGRLDAASRLGLTHRRRTSIDYASDTEASVSRGYTRRGYTQHTEGASGGWKAPPPLLGLSATTPTSALQSSHLQGQPDSRSNSLPRGSRFRREVHFESASSGAPSRPAPPLQHHLDSLDDSDGAVSAPELSEKQKQLQRLSQQHQQLLYGRSILSGSTAPGGMPMMGGSGPGAGPTGNFTAAEYKAWMQRAPSTSAIYERLRQGREAIEAHRTAKLTFSAENLVEKSKQDTSYYAYRTHFSSSKPGMDETDSSAVSLMGANKALMSSGRTGGSDELHQSDTSRSGMILQPTPGSSGNISAAASASAASGSARPNDPRFKLLEINPADFVKYRSERPNGVGVAPSTQQMSTAPSGGTSTPSTGGGPGPAPGGGIEEGVSGLLWIHLLAGRGLRSTSSRLEPVRDLYCVLECDRAHKARTVIRSGDINFDWDETFDLDLVVNRELDFLIYSWDPQLRHRLCFKGSLHLVPLVRESTIHQVALKVEPRGTLYLKLRYTEPRTAFRRLPAPRKAPPPLFGVDLETVVNREGSSVAGAGVPILVQKCVEEVERRGMDIVGLYRLCGSATKKRILREAFERNPRLVDLSPDSVPDINVITGLLKEYLRELPEPLLTKCLYQMLVDALAVCLPDDPEGNAKLMFSILECLPKSNRTTLFLLMDHLCLVTAQSDRNKMTPQNLAICFGPVLMLHSDDSSAGAGANSSSSGGNTGGSGGSLDFQKPIGVLKYLLQIWPMKSARAVEAAATASTTLRRLQLQQQLQQVPSVPAVQQSSSAAGVAVTTSSMHPPPSPMSLPVPATASTPVPTPAAISSTIANSSAAAAAAMPVNIMAGRVADRKMDLPPLPPRPAPRVLQPRVSSSSGSSSGMMINSSGGSVKSPRALVPLTAGGMAGSATSSETGTTHHVIQHTRGEADGSPAPLSTDSAAGAGSETPSLTSPTSSTTSLSPLQPNQPPPPPLRANVDGRRSVAQLHHKDFNSEDASLSSSLNNPIFQQQQQQQHSQLSGRMMMSNNEQLVDPSGRAADDTDQGESDLDSPN